MTTILCISASAVEADGLLANGPRRDFVELARITKAEILLREGRTGRGLISRIVGPHLRQGWTAAGRVSSGDCIFADGEHIGLPLAILLTVRRRDNVRLTMIGHLVDKWWKVAMFAVASRCWRSPTVVAVHSTRQRDILAPFLGRRWTIMLTPYQVDTDFWRASEATEPGPQPILLAVGSENRDYDTLVAAVEDLPVHVRIAAGSHWARKTAGAKHLPDNVEYFAQPLSFAELRAAYDEALAVVVPLRRTSNQSGVTTILEAMSMGRPVITTATDGQRECVVGHGMNGDGSTDDSTDDRGPEAFGAPAGGGPTGWYTPLRDAPALRAAIQRILGDPVHAGALGVRGREVAAAHFRLEDYVSRLAAIIGGEASPTQTTNSRTSA